MSTQGLALLRLSAFYFILTLTLINPTLCHKGHDHGDDDHSSHGHDKEEIPEKDPNWMTATRVPFPKGSGFDLRWKQESDKVLTMKMTAKTNGYVAVGFCSRWLGTMEGCDIVLGWVDNTNGSVNVHDYHATGNSIPLLDDKQDYSEGVLGHQKDGFTSVTFKRKMNTGDELKDADLWHNNVHVIYAWNDEDPISPQDFKRHEIQGRGHTLSAVSFKNGGEHDHHSHGASGATSSLMVGGVSSLSALFQTSVLILHAFYWGFNNQ